MKRLFAPKTKNIKSSSIKEEAVHLKNMEEFLEERIKFCQTIQSKYQKLIEYEEKKQKIEGELDEIIKNYEKEVIIMRHDSPEIFSENIKHIIDQI